MEGLLTSGPLQVAITLLVVALLDQLWQIPAASHPLTAMRFLARRMADKVLPAQDSPVSQHYISGSLGFIMLVGPLMLILVFFIFVAEHQWFFDGVLLYLALALGSTTKRIKRIIQYLGDGKKMLARETLAQLVARDCSTLSDIGIAKAAIETLLLRYYTQYCGVVFWYCLTGGLGALFYRLVLEFSYTWHFRQPGFTHFAKPIRLLAKLMSVVPQCIAAFIMLFVSDAFGAIKALKAAKVKDITSLLLASFGGGQGILLGGPAIYHGVKYRYPRVGGPRQVKYSDMTYCYRAVMRHFWLSLILTALFSVIILQLISTY